MWGIDLGGARQVTSENGLEAAAKSRQEMAKNWTMEWEGEKAGLWTSSQSQSLWVGSEEHQ